MRVKVIIIIVLHGSTVLKKKLLDWKGTPCMGVQPSTVKTTHMASHLEWLGSLIPGLAHNVPLFFTP